MSLGQLQNGGRAGPVEAAQAAPRCLAKTRSGSPCQRPACRGRSRCHLHGGRSTGPTTAAGRDRVRWAQWKHGERSAAAQASRLALRRLFVLLKGMAAGEDVSMADLFQADRLRREAQEALQFLRSRVPKTRGPGVEKPLTRGPRRTTPGSA